MIGRVFVYGTLQPGQFRWPILAPFSAGSNAVSASGLLFDTPYGWPAAVFDPFAGDRIPGVMVRMSAESIVDALMTLDAVEGVAEGLFQRIVVDVRGDACWAYHWPGPTDTFRRVDGWPPVAE